MKPRLIPCPTCGGIGDASTTSPAVSAAWCPQCDGAGRIPDRRRVDAELGQAFLILLVAVACAALVVLAIAAIRRG